MPDFKVTVNGSNIRSYPFPKSPIQITMEMEFEEQEARIFAGLTLQEYDQLPGGSRWCDAKHPMSKSQIVAMYQLHKLINLVRDHVSSKKGKPR